ncbi:hypothetical protein SpCBS45565_g05413 [Spizellomyces sp. 'palustris']|nr:hypothetical protein SpCBS45565_g05413 [Spizellomyces sp. 'palustris']
MCKREKYVHRTDNRVLKVYRRADGTQYYNNRGTRKTLRIDQHVVTKARKTDGCCRQVKRTTSTKMAVKSGQGRCHIISRKNGGSDHPDNMYACPSPVNRSQQHRMDHLNCRDVKKKRCMKAIAVSRATGYKGTYASLMKKGSR